MKPIILLNLVSIVMLLVSCQDGGLRDNCSDEIEVAPLGHSEVTLEVATVHEVPNVEVYFWSKKCPDSQISGIMASETMNHISDWLEDHGFERGIYSINESVEISIYKYGQGKGEFFVVAFWGQSGKRDL